MSAGDLVALRRTLRRHQIVVADQETRIPRCYETLRDYRAEAEALARAITRLEVDVTIADATGA